MSTRMETTPVFYGSNGIRGKEDVNQLKRKMTLDFGNTGKSSSKKQKFNPVLSSPDLNLLKLGSPELERFIIQQNLLSTPTPSQFNFPKNVTEEQEQYARGFVDALAQMHQSESSNESDDDSQMTFQQLDAETNSTIGSEPVTYTTLESNNVPLSVYTTASIGSNNMQVPNSMYNPVTTAASFLNLPGIPPVTIKEEPITVSNINSPLMSPIDMEGQEKIKLERKRQRNRVAASKCRRRKLERISRLEDRVKHLKGENQELINVKNKLKQDVCILKQEMMEHLQSGCQIMVSAPPQY